MITTIILIGIENYFLNEDETENTKKETRKSDARATNDVAYSKNDDYENWLSLKRRLGIYL